MKMPRFQRYGFPFQYYKPYNYRPRTPTFQPPPPPEEVVVPSPPPPVYPHCVTLVVTLLIQH